MGAYGGFFKRQRHQMPAAEGAPVDSDLDKDNEKLDESRIKILRLRIIAMVLIVSLGGLIFGYDTGQISGFTAMPDFIARFGNVGNPPTGFTPDREGTIVAILSIGTLVGALVAGPLSDKTGRKISIVFWNLVFIAGVIIQITTTRSWIQLTVGRAVAGLGVGGLSLLTPMYQAETAPRQIRGALVSCYQLFITLGIFIAYCINYGTHNSRGAAQWKITMGIGFVFPVLMITGIVFLRESPRWDFRHGKNDAALHTVCLSYGVGPNHKEVVREMREIREKFEAETVGTTKDRFIGVFTGPRMLYRTLLGITLQALQQLTGANYFFYYGTQIFDDVGIPDSFVTSMILGGVNFGSTFLGLYVVENFGRRKSLIVGGLCMFVCFMIFSSIGAFRLYPAMQAGIRDKPAGTVMIVFACLFIFVYAQTWAPIVWALVAEIYPSRYRAKAMGLATASNWTWNFLLAFFTRFITDDINFKYGYIFAACNFAGAVVVYFFVCESQGRSLEEIDTMYVEQVKPWQSSHWEPPKGAVLGRVDESLKDRDMRMDAGDERRESVV